MFSRLLVANRGEIARRILRTCRRMGIETVAVYSTADADAPHVREAGEARPLRGAAPRDSYLDQDQILAIARETGADAVHPGYGFLSESAAFARAVEAAGLGWIGPAPAAMEAMADKAEAKALVSSAGVPIAPGSVGIVPDLAAALRIAADVGFPLMLKASGGGGGIGMGIAGDAVELERVYERVTGQALRSFGSAGVILERYMPHARHIEIQILGLATGEVIALGDRECSVQRRHQKLAEESPAPAIAVPVRAAMRAAGIAAAEAVAYRGAGTIEFLLDEDGETFTFLEMNTRLQVEHPVTELVWGIDLVEAQLRIAAGEVDPGFDPATIRPRGHAIEFRICAEDPIRFLPAPGVLESYVEPAGESIRVDAAYDVGVAITPYYDSLLAKLCVWGEDRASALDRMAAALEAYRIAGVTTNIPFFERLLRHPPFVEGRYDTGVVEGVLATTAPVSVTEPRRTP